VLEGGVRVDDGDVRLVWVRDGDAVTDRLECAAKHFRPVMGIVVVVVVLHLVYSLAVAFAASERSISAAGLSPEAAGTSASTVTNTLEWLDLSMSLLLRSLLVQI
jgi:hypothetical protein